MTKSKLNVKRETAWKNGVLILMTVIGGWCIGQQYSPFTLVHGNSMEPTLHSGQMLRVNHDVPQYIPRGTIVLVSRFPLPPLVKRIVGLPHETVSFEVGEVFINGKFLRENYLPEVQTTFSWKFNPLAASENEYVLLGDNRLTSQDSREYGIVPRKKIIGTIDIPWAPPELLDHAHYRITKDGNRPIARTREGDDGKTNVNPKGWKGG